MSSWQSREGPSHSKEGPSGLLGAKSYVPGRIKDLLLAGDATRNGMIAFIDQAICGATAFLTTVIVARKAGKEELGLYALGFGLASVILDLQNSVVLTPYTVYSPRLQGDALAAYNFSTLIHVLSISLLSMVSFMILGMILSFGVGPVGLSSVCWALILAIPAMLLRQYARMVSFAGIRMETALSVDLIVGVLQIGGLLGLVYLNVYASAYQAYYIIAAACGVGAGSWLFRERRKFVGSFLQAISDFRRNWQFVKWLTTTVPVANLRGQINPWLLAFFYGPSATGVYSACLNVTSLANPFLLGFGNIIGPMAAHSYARGRIRDLRNYILRAHVPIGLGMAIFWVAMLIFGGRFVSLIYGDNYNGLGAVVSLLAAAIFMGALCIPPRRGLLALESSRAVFVSEFLPLMLQVSLGLWLVLNFQIWGAAAAFLIGSIIELVILEVIFTKDVKSPVDREKEPIEPCLP